MSDMKNASKVDLERTVASATRVLNAIREREWEAEVANLVGTCWRYPNNDGVGGNRWPLYAKVTKAADGQVNTFEFQSRPDGQTEIKERGYYYRRLMGGFQRIPERQFQAAWRRVKSRVEKLNP